MFVRVELLYGTHERGKGKEKEHQQDHKHHTVQAEDIRMHTESC
jgi:hypothetical protein